MQKTLFIVLFCLAAFASASISDVTADPIPDVLIKVNELYPIDLSQYFHGYNLQYDLGNTTVGKVDPTSVAQGSEAFNVTTAGEPNLAVVSGHYYPRGFFGSIDHSKKILHITTNNDLIWSTLADTSSAPTIQDQLNIVNSNTAICFGVELLPNNIAVVDCSDVEYAPNSTTVISRTDTFYFFDLSSKQLITKYDSPASTATSYDPKTSSAAPRDVRIATFGTSVFVFRYIGTDAITDPDQKNQSYVEVYQLTGKTTLTPVTGIFANTVGASTLSIKGFEILNSSIVIACASGYAYLLNAEGFEVNYNFKKVVTLNLSEPLVGVSTGFEATEYYTKATVLIYSAKTAWEYDWTFVNSPSLVNQYDLSDSFENVYKADFSSQFVYVQYNNNTNTNIVFIPRGSNGLSDFLGQLPTQDAFYNNWWTVDRDQNNFYLLNANQAKISNTHNQPPLLHIQSSDITSGTLTVTATHEKGNQTASSTVAYNIIGEKDFSIYVNTSNFDVTVNYPSNQSINLDNVASGPGLQYTINNTNISSNVLDYEFVNIAFTGATTNGTITFQKVAVSPVSAGTLGLLIQDSKSVVFYYTCLEYLDSKADTVSLQCSLVNSFTLAGPITNMVSTDNSIVITYSDGTTPFVAFYSFDKFVQSQLVPLVAPDNACTDLEVTINPDGNLLLCLQGAKNRILAWDATNPVATTSKTIDISAFSSSEIPIFTPQDLVVHKAHPDLLFIKNDKSILVLDIDLFWTKGLVNYINTITPTAATSWSFTVNFDSLVVFLSNAATPLTGTTSIEEYRITSNPSTTLKIKTYTQFYDYEVLADQRSEHFSSQNSNHVYTLVRTTKSEKTDYNYDVLVLAAGATANGNFLNRINVIDPTSVPVLSSVRSTSVNVEYVFLTYTNTVVAYAVYDSTTLNFEAQMNNASLTSETSTLTLEAGSVLDTTAPRKEIMFNLTTINVQTPIVPGDLTKNADALKFDITSGSAPAEIYFNATGFFGGVVTHWSITPENPDDVSKMLLLPNVSQKQSAYNTTSKFADLQRVGGSIYAQGANTLVIIDAETGKSQPDIPITTNVLPANQECTHVVAGDLFTTSFCKDNTQPTIGYLVTVSLLSSSPSTLTPLQVSISSVNTMKKIGNYIFILENINGDILSPNAGLYVFDYSNPAKPVAGPTFDPLAFGAIGFQITEYATVAIGNNAHRFYLVDAEFGVRTVEWANGQWSNPQSISLRNNFTQDALPISAHFVGIGITKKNGDNEVYAAIVTDIHNSYYVKFTSSESGITAVLLATYTKILSANNRNKVAASSGNFTYFAVSSSVNSSGHITIFNATGLENSANVAGETIGYLEFPGAVDNSDAFDFYKKDGDVSIWSFVPQNSINTTRVNNTNTTQLLQADEDKLNTIAEFRIRPYFSLLILDSNVTSNHISVTGRNANSEQTVEFAVTHDSPTPPGPNPPGPNPDPTPTGGLRWWAWLLIVLGILLVIAAILAYLRYRNKKHHEDIEFSNDANVPLTTNYA